MTESQMTDTPRTALILKLWGWKKVGPGEMEPADWLVTWNEAVDHMHAAAAELERALTNSAPHVHTDKCGFDRNSSHSQGRYVCECGWSEPAAPSGVEERLRRYANHHAGHEAPLLIEAADELYRLASALAREKAAREAAERALCELTPGGSEYAGDVQACARYIRRVREAQHETILAAQRHRKDAEEALESQKQVTVWTQSQLDSARADLAAANRRAEELERSILQLSETWNEHPEINGELWDGPCNCKTCQSYATDDGDARSATEGKNVR